MFVISIDYSHDMSYYLIKEFRMCVCFWDGGSYKMNDNEHLKAILSMLKEMDESDSLFLKQLYTIIHRHLLRKRGD